MKVGDNFYAENDYPGIVQTVTTELGYISTPSVWRYVSTPTWNTNLAGNPVKLIPHIPFQNGLLLDNTVDVSGDTELKFIINSDDYFHTLLCTLYLHGKTPSGDDAIKKFVAKRLKDDSEGALYDNVFMQPKYNRPYYDITNALDYKLEFGTSRNAATVELKLGKMPSNMFIGSIVFDYLKLPEIIEVTDDDLYGAGADASQILEFPETLRTKFITGVTEGLLEYANNPRTQSLPQISNKLPPVPVELLMGNNSANNTQQQQQQ